MSKIIEVALASAIQQVANMDLAAKEAVWDEIFREQPNLLASVLVLTKMDISQAHIEVALEALMVAHVALADSDVSIKTITEKEQERELQRLVASVKFTEGMAPESVDESIKQYAGFREEPWLLEHVIKLLRDNGVLVNNNDNLQYLMLVSLNLVGCIANA